MNRIVAQLLTRLYPRDWRERYGEEFLALLEDGRGGLRTSANVLWSALRERISPTHGGNMDQQMNSFGAIIKRPSAFLPMAMSLTALTLVLVHIAVFGAAREADEGTTAHLWQLLIAGQMPILAIFAIKWLPRAPRQTLYVLALQAGAASNRRKRQFVLLQFAPLPGTAACFPYQAHTPRHFVERCRNNDVSPGFDCTGEGYPYDRELIGEGIAAVD